MTLNRIMATPDLQKGHRYLINFQLDGQDAKPWGIFKYMGDSDFKEDSDSATDPWEILLHEALEIYELPKRK